MEARMEHIKFFEEQANKSANSSNSGPPTNHFSDGQQNGVKEKPKLKKITTNMPKWQIDKLLKENERIKEEIRKFEEREHEEQKKWVGLPEWKVKILKEKEVLQKQKDEEERRTRIREEKKKQEWESLPPWRKSLLAMKGVAGFTQGLEDKQASVNHVTKADSAEDGESENSSEIPEDDGDNPEDSIGEDDIEQENDSGDEKNGVEEEDIADEQVEGIQENGDVEEDLIENGQEENEGKETEADGEELEEAIEGNEEEAIEGNEEEAKEDGEDAAEENVKEKAEQEVVLMEFEVDASSHPQSTE